ncbi:hypothetical protein NW762_011743 [Fusarium torreyae]|uniref:Uncharacterized protein n=1 Tax=Fusarium torreyae TaxID=1237075 RepID=A0A9W8RPB1_9HYPO|nr:hypothetical protein NW762_011743 [Fusarium torreyae]
MASSNKTGRATSGATVARDFNNTLNNMVAFEAMRFTADYARIAQNELRACDYQELMLAVRDAAKLLPETVNPSRENEWPAEAEEINERIENKLKDYDKLAGGFKKLVENAHAAGIAAKRQQ